MFIRLGGVRQQPETTVVHAPEGSARPPTDDARETTARVGEVLTVEELAGFLRVNHKTVRDAITRGEIPGVRRTGGAIRMYRAAVVDWVAAGQGRASGSRSHR